MLPDSVDLLITYFIDDLAGTVPPTADSLGYDHSVRPGQANQ